MKYIALLFVVSFFISNAVEAQTYLNFTYSSPPVPAVNAGNDTSGTVGDTIILSPMVSGGTAPLSYRWSPGNAVLDSTVLNAAYILTSTGSVTLTLTITDANGCTVTDEVIISGLIGIDERIKVITEIFPNPSNGSFMIKGLSGMNSNTEVAILALDGREILRTQLPIHSGTATFNSQGLSTGVYLLKIEGPDEFIFHKIIIQ